MKAIIQQIFGSKSAKESEKLTAWMNDLADTDELSALKLSTTKLAQLMEIDALNAQQKLETLLELDELNLPRLEKLATQFVQVANLKPDLENDIRETCYMYCRQTYVAYLKLIEQVMQPSHATVNGETPILVIARAIHASFNMTKWRMFMQHNAPTKVWLQLYMLYKIAYKHNLLSTPIEIFPLSPSTTLSACIVQMCMLGQLVQANMQKHHVEVAARVLKAWLTRAHISATYTPEQYLFFVDLEQDLSAKRMRLFEPVSSCRYWELDDFEKQLNVAITVTDRGEMPESLLFSKIDSVKTLNETLNIIHSEWRRNEYVRQRRREERQATSKTAAVSAGILDICDQVLHANQVKNGFRIMRNGKTLDELLRGHTVLKDNTSSLKANSNSLNTWIITDESEHGFGARVNKFANIVAKPDKLIAMVMEDEADKVIIGMIKSTKPTQGNQQKVGIEIVSHRAIWVQLQLAEDTSSFLDTVNNVSSRNDTIQTESTMFSGIYLPAEEGISTAASLILPKLHFKPNTNYIIHMNGKHRRSTLTTPIDSRDDWVKVAA